MRGYIEKTAILLGAGSVSAKEFRYTTEIPEGITIPDKVETSIGTLSFTDGDPSRGHRLGLHDCLPRWR